MVDLNTLLMFAKVVEANSFSEAARRLRMPVSTLSRRIAEMEDQLGVRLLERSTRTLRLTDLGADIFEQARRSAELNDAVESIVSSSTSEVTGALRLSCPPNISDTLVVPLVQEFQARFPAVRVQIFVTQRAVDHIVEGIDLAFRYGQLKDSALVGRKILRYRHQLVASPDYLERAGLPQHPRDLARHRLLTFSFGSLERRWTFVQQADSEQFTLSFSPHLAMNDYAGLASALLSAGGIGDLPPIVRPELLRDRQLVEVMPEWHLPCRDLTLVYTSNRNTSHPVRLFKEFAIETAPRLFPDLPV
ncbi:HTH-type transcriptional regulator DmlR [Mycolicibacterium aubagnense]